MTAQQGNQLLPASRLACYARHTTTPEIREQAHTGRNSLCPSPSPQKKHWTTRQKDVRAVPDDTLTFSVIIQRRIMPNATSTSLWQTKPRTKDHANVQYQGSPVGSGNSLGNPTWINLEPISSASTKASETSSSLDHARQPVLSANVSTHCTSSSPVLRTKGMQTTGMSSPNSSWW